MKHKIETEQWDELSTSAKNIWRRWSYDNGYVEVDKEGKSAVMPMPNLIQMITFLRSRKSVFVSFVDNEKEHLSIVNGIEKEELSDALWENVKNCL